MQNPKIEITTTRTDLIKQLSDEWSSPFQHIGEHRGDGKQTFAIWLNEKDSEPQTAKGMMKVLNIHNEWKHLLDNKLVDLVVDDRALIINI